MPPDPCVLFVSRVSRVLCVSCPGVPLSALFELVPVSLPSAKKDKAAHDAAVAELRRKLRSLHADGFGKVGKPDALPDAATAAWAAVQAAAGTKPSDVQLRDRYFLSQAYEVRAKTRDAAPIARETFALDTARAIRTREFRLVSRSMGEVWGFDQERGDPGRGPEPAT
eukprot:272289-Pleurochrysis_carterae.AAC.1